MHWLEDLAARNGFVVPLYHLLSPVTLTVTGDPAAITTTVSAD